MIFIQWKFWTINCVIIQAFIIFSAFYAYRTNAKRAPDDPEKKDYPPYAPWLAPIILPLLILFNIPVFILFALAFGFFLVFFPFALLLFRKPFLIKWILKQALKVGNWVLRINSKLLKAAGFYPVSIKFQYE
jgi:hypothetical protein